MNLAQKHASRASCSPSFAVGYRGYRGRFLFMLKPRFIEIGVTMNIELKRAIADAIGYCKHPAETSWDKAGRVMHLLEERGMLRVQTKPTSISQWGLHGMEE